MDFEKARLEKIKEGCTDEDVVRFITTNGIPLKKVVNLKIYPDFKIKKFAKDHIKSTVDHFELIKEYLKENFIQPQDVTEEISELLVHQKVAFDSIISLQLFSEGDLKHIAIATLTKSDNKEEWKKKLVYYYVNKILSEADVVNNKLATKEEFNRMIGREIEPARLEASDLFLPSFKNLPAPVANRTNVFILGIVGSGKSVFLAGLMYHIWKLGMLRRKTKNNMQGVVYINSLIDAISNKKLPSATPEDMPIYVEADIISKNEETIPLTIFDMSGEIFRKAYGNQINDMPQNFIKYIRHENNKVFILAVDYDAHPGQFQQGQQLETILTSLSDDGVMDYTNSICILITKWDRSGFTHLSEEAQMDHAENFLRIKYANLVRMCIEFSKKYKFRFSIFTYSLGKFNEYNGEFEFEPDYSDKIYEWMCTMPKVIKEKEGGLFSRLFNKK